MSAVTVTMAVGAKRRGSAGSGSGSERPVGAKAAQDANRRGQSGPGKAQLRSAAALWCASG